MKKLFLGFMAFLMINQGVIRAQDVRWADRVVAYSTQYEDKKDTTAYRARQVLGPPRVMPCSKGSIYAWSPANPDEGEEFITVGFRNPAPARQVVVNENTSPRGTVKEVILYDESDNAYSVYKTTPGPIETDCDKALVVAFPQTAYRVAKVKVVIDTKAVPEWNHIDAIGLSDSEKPITIGIHLGDNPVLVTEAPESLGDKVNTQYSELLPVISTDGTTLYFTRAGHPDNPGAQKNQSAWMSKLQADGTWGVAEILPAPVNNEGHNAILGVLPDGNTLLLNNRYIKGTTGERGVSTTVREGDGWAFPTNLEIKNYQNKSNYGESCLGPNGKVLIQTVDRDDPANLGSKDLYVSFLENDGTWTVPLHMGNVINTSASETSPFLAADGVTMYYSTAGFLGYGNNDMYMTRRLDDTWINWSQPVNLGPNFNSPGFDAYCTIPAKGDYVYFVRSVTDRLEDIFRAKLPAPLKPNPVVLIRGKVLNAKTKEPMAASIRYEYLEDGKDAGIASSALPAGDYRIVLPAGHLYGFRAEADGFIAINENLEVKALELYSEITRDLYLVPIEVGQTIRLNNIFFETAKFDLRNESFAELNRLVDILKQNPTVKIEISGHTDNTGTPAINQPLSQNRAKSVQDYLVSKGVSVDRLVAKGYAATKPVGDNTTAEGRQFNRRVEFTILTK
ncbi:MAG: OmpA family protein [Bacteroidetes bacterium]|nr:OmpA family protein [Bacteroidota bacterium]